VCGVISISHAASHDSREEAVSLLDKYVSAAGSGDKKAFDHALEAIEVVWSPLVQAPAQPVAAAAAAAAAAAPIGAEARPEKQQQQGKAASMEDADEVGSIMAATAAAVSAPAAAPPAQNVGWRTIWHLNLRSAPFRGPPSIWLTFAELQVGGPGTLYSLTKNRVVSDLLARSLNILSRAEGRYTALSPDEVRYLQKYLTRYLPQAAGQDPKTYKKHAFDPPDFAKYPGEVVVFEIPDDCDLTYGEYLKDKQVFAFAAARSKPGPLFEVAKAQALR